MEWIPKLRRSDWLILLGLTVLYFATRLYNLTALPIFVDEAIYSRWSQISLHDASWRFISLTDGKQPLFVWAAMLPLKLFADPLFATRLISVLSGFLTMTGLFYAGFLLKDKKFGFIAAFLSLITPYLFFYDRFATMEGMLVASGVWLLILGYMLCRTLRLDIALILGMAGGLALLVKSPALIYLLLIPVMYPFVSQVKITRSRLFRFAGLFLISAFLAVVIYNIQRLSPWMHMIGAKNNDFVVSPIYMLREEPIRIWHNFSNSQRWLWAYLTGPLFLTALAGIYFAFRDHLRRFFVISAWFWGPYVATLTSAMLFRPRYLVFAVPFALFYASSLLYRLAPRYLAAALIALSVLPGIFMYRAWLDPLHTPFVRDDSDYVSGWAAGSGVQEISAWLKERRRTGGELDVYTEGTFGLLPHGLELYTNDTPGIRITGIYPVNEIPPLEVAEKAKENRETYFILNNTQVSSVPERLEEVAAYKKADNSWIRLYRVAAIP